MGMQYEQTKYVGDVQILKRKPFEAIPMTLDFSSVGTKLTNGKKVVKAGTPIGSTGRSGEEKTTAERLVEKYYGGQKQENNILSHYVGGN